jgi:hypothetical protein
METEYRTIPDLFGGAHITFFDPDAHQTPQKNAMTPRCRTIKIF